MDSSSNRDVVKVVVEEFRRHLEMFYARLQLAPPYDTVEKAVAHLAQTLTSMAPEDRAGMLADPSLRWQYYTDSFRDSGLAQKHRGIIAGLIRGGRADVSEEYRAWLNLFRHDAT